MSKPVTPIRRSRPGSGGACFISLHMYSFLKAQGSFPSLPPGHNELPASTSMQMLAPDPRYAEEFQLGDHCCTQLILIDQLTSPKTLFVAFFPAALAFSLPCQKVTFGIAPQLRAPRCASADQLPCCLPLYADKESRDAAAPGRPLLSSSSRYVCVSSLISCYSFN